MSTAAGKCTRSSTRSPASAADGWTRICLKGNHEDMMLGFLAGTHPLDVWLMNGGDATLAAYGADLGGAGRTRAWAFGAARAGRRTRRPGPRSRPRCRRPMPRFSTRCPSIIGAATTCSCMPAYGPACRSRSRIPQDLMWIRETFLGSDADHGAVVVHGHTIFNEVDIRPNRIGVDTGAWRSGRLSCIVLEGDEVRVIQT